MSSKLQARDHRWESALCRVSSCLLILAALFIWGSLSISRGSLSLTAQHSYEEAVLLPGFHLLEHKQKQHLGDEHGQLSTEAGAAEQQETVVFHSVPSDVPGYPGPPYILPKLVHQTVKDKNSMSCEVQESIQSWIDMNPGYTHILYDDNDLLDFVKEHYPELLPVYQGLPSNIERTDTWRYLVLHKLGGVYADSDVKCMQPISTWNQENNHDAALLVGIAKRNMKTGDTREFNQFVMAAMPGHPVLASMPLVIAGNLAYSHLKGLPMKGQGKKVDEQILMRTGPMAFTSALKAYANRIGAKWPINSTLADQQHGVLFGTVRAMPKFVLGTGWDTLDHNMTCDEVKKLIRPEALICHQFFGTWKTKPEKQLQSRTFTYGDCNKKMQTDAAAGAAADNQEVTEPDETQAEADAVDGATATAGADGAGEDGFAATAADGEGGDPDETTQALQDTGLAQQTGPSTTQQQQQRYLKPKQRLPRRGQMQHTS